MVWVICKFSTRKYRISRFNSIVGAHTHTHTHKHSKPWRIDGSIDSKPLSLDNSCFEFRQRPKPFESRPGKKSDSFHFWTRLEGIDFSNLACNLLCFDVSCQSGMHMPHPFRIKAQEESNRSEILYRMGCPYRMLRGNWHTTGQNETSYYMATCLLFYAGLWGWHFLHRTDCKVAILQRKPGYVLRRPVMIWRLPRDFQGELHMSLHYSTMNVSNTYLYSCL